MSRTLRSLTRRSWNAISNNSSTSKRCFSSLYDYFDKKNAKKNEIKSTNSSKPILSQLSPVNSNEIYPQRTSDIVKAEEEDLEEFISENIHRLGTPTRTERHVSYKFVDKVFIEVRGGNGGNGCISFEFLGGPHKKRPNGGSGGKGGNVYIVADKSLFGLNFDTFHFNGGHGHHGMGEGMTGKNGKDVYVKVPVGTLVTERYPHEEEFDTEVEEDVEMHDETCSKSNNPVVELDQHNDTLLVAEGGQPGCGNVTQKGNSDHRARSVPQHQLPGQPGDIRWLLLELKVIADIGLVGYPNAGKSSLLRCLSNAKPKVAAYPFTTLHPMVGTVEYSDSGRITVADIPGLIEGAHENRGLGHDFLRHIERTKVLLFIIDAAATESRSPVKDFRNLVNELARYDEDLLRKPALVFGNKFDLKVDGRHLVALKRATDSLGWKFLSGSAETGDGMGDLAKELRIMVETLNKPKRTLSSKR